MKLAIVGKPHGVGVTHEVIRTSIKYFKSILIPCELPINKAASVEIRLIPNLYSDYGQTGFSSAIDGPINPTRFIMELDDAINLRSTIITAAHEFAHVRQLLLGIWQQSIADSADWWHGVRIDTRDMNYYDLPWEIDAHGREYGMYHRFINRDSDRNLDYSSNVA